MITNPHHDAISPSAPRRRAATRLVPA